MHYFGVESTKFVGSKKLKNDRKPLFTVLCNLRAKSTVSFLVALIIILTIIVYFWMYTTNC